MLDAWPMELTLVQSPRLKLDADALMHQDFHAIGATIGEQICAGRLLRTEHGNNRSSAVLVPARMYIGSVASQAARQIASMRITGQRPE